MQSVLRRSLLLVVVATGVWLGSCVPVRPVDVGRVRLTECSPPPEPQCQPQQWSGTPLDTAATGQSPYWRIRPVRGAATEQQEYALCFLDRTRALLTRGTTATQHLTLVRSVASDSVAVVGELTTPAGTRSLGAAAAAGDRVFASALLEEPRIAQVVLLRNFSSTDAPQLTTLPLDSTAWLSHPAISHDGSLLVVAAERPGGIGGVDLWYATRRNDGSWDTLRNLGSTINTACNELSPFFCNDTTLLFASNGHPSVGGYDIFVAYLVRTRNGVDISRVENVRPPINTAADELFPSTPLQDYRQLLYWSSDRRDGNFDLYVAERVQPLRATPPIARADTPQTRYAKVRGRVRTPSKRPVDNADITIRDLERQQLIAQTRTDTAGTFEATAPTERRLEITAQSGTGFYDVRRITIPRTDSVYVLADDFVIPDVLTLRINFPYDEARKPYEFVLDSNGNETDRRWTEELDRVAANLLQYRDRIKRVILVGHTDPQGSIAYNYRLGMRRVQFVIEELIKRGVPAEMLEGRSAGKTQLLPRRAGEPLEQYYRRNRRVELSKVLQ